MNTWLEPTTLAGQHVTLIPLREEHADALVAAEQDGNLSSLWFTSVPNAETVHQYLAQAFAEQLAGRALPFAVIDNKTNDIIGSTRYCNAVANHNRLEIGYTWYKKSYQRSPVNTECKLLLLTHAFEQLNAIAVEFRTHWHNNSSRNAIARLGAKQDGVLRNHQRQADGTLRDTVVFSIVNTEWPGVKKNLMFKLDR